LENQYNVDNGAMIAVLGQKEFSAGRKPKLHETSINAFMRTDD
jgi:tRNA A37 threonylcarbamoyltransferase TsaD